MNCGGSCGCYLAMRNCREKLDFQMTCCRSYFGIVNGAAVMHCYYSDTDDAINLHMHVDLFSKALYRVNVPDDWDSTSFDHTMTVTIATFHCLFDDLRHQTFPLTDFGRGADFADDAVDDDD